MTDRFLRRERRLVFLLAVSAALLSLALFFLVRRDAVHIDVVPPPFAEASA